jgi:CDP-glucose 4,6-dehydratase
LDWRKRAVENLEMKDGFWKGKRVLVTGHTGFKGGWLTVWLRLLGADVIGFALRPETQPNLFGVAQIESGVRSLIADIRDLQSVMKVVEANEPEIVFHLAAQPLVRRSYLDPVETYATNVMGTVHLLEAIRRTRCARAIVNVTSDKCYQNNEWHWGYREIDRIGGRDPYSNSKGCAELVTAAFRGSFFQDGSGLVGIASARAGNVVGGGDFSVDRLVPDVVRAIRAKEQVTLRSPLSVRPWQHVLDPLSGYLTLAEHLSADPREFSEAWNFGPDADGMVSVRELVQNLIDSWGSSINIAEGLSGEHQPHEARLLTLDSTKARVRLKWRPGWLLQEALLHTVNLYKAFDEPRTVRTLMEKQITEYSSVSDR